MYTITLKIKNIYNFTKIFNMIININVYLLNFNDKY